MSVVDTSITQEDLDLDKRFCAAVKAARKKAIVMGVAYTGYDRRRRKIYTYTEKDGKVYVG